MKLHLYKVGQYAYKSTDILKHLHKRTWPTFNIQSTLLFQCLWFLNIEQCSCVMRLRICLLTEIKRYKSAIRISIRILV